MSFWLTNHLLNQTSIFGLKLWLLLAICASVAAAAAAALLFLLLLLSLRRRFRRLPSPTPSVSSPPPPRKPLKLLLLESTPQVSKQILPISPVPNSNGEHRVSLFLNENHNRLPLPPPSPSASASTSGESKYSAAAQPPPPHDVNHLGWGQWFTLRELELATDHFADENVIGEGGYGVVYRGVLDDHNVVAVKNLLNNRGQAEREFKVEVEAMGRVRHKNLVKLLGFCVEGAHR